MPRGAAGNLKIRDRRSDIFRGDIAAAHMVDSTAEGLEQFRGLVGAGIADNDGLSAAEVDPRQRGFVGHATGQTQHVGEGFRFVCIVPHTGSTECRSEGRIMNSDNRFQP